MPEAFFEEIVKEGLIPITPNTITSESRLQEELSLIRQHGYAIDDEENAEGVCCVASAVWDGMGEVVGGISVSGPITRINLSNFKVLGPLICESAQVISQKMGYVS